MSTTVAKLTRKEKIAQGLPKEKHNRKFRAAEARKAEQRTISSAYLHGVPSSPRKMRLVADMIRGQKVEHALNILQLSTRHASRPLQKLLISAVNNFEQKNPDQAGNTDSLYVKEIQVDGGLMLPRTRPAPQGRAYRIRKRSNHITLVLDIK